MNRRTAHSHRDEEYRHELLQQRLMAPELSGMELAREVFGEPLEIPVRLDSIVTQLVDEAESLLEVDDSEESDRRDPPRAR